MSGFEPQHATYHSANLRRLLGRDEPRGLEDIDGQQQGRNDCPHACPDCGGGSGGGAIQVLVVQRWRRGGGADDNDAGGGGTYDAGQQRVQERRASPAEQLFCQRLRAPSEGEDQVRYSAMF